MRVRNLLFSACIIALLCLPCFLFILAHSGCQVSGLLTTDRAKYLAGGVNDVDVASKFNVDDFASGLFQASLSDGIDNYIPLKYYVLLCNAGLQRTFIEASNALFGWGCYPTRLDTSAVYVPRHDAIRGKAVQSLEDGQEEGLRAFSSEIAKWANSHPDIQVCVFIPEQSAISERNPSYGLTSDPLNLASYLDLLNEGVSDVPNVEFLSKSYDDLAEYLGDFYYTDDHWNGFGACAAYNEIAQNLALPSLDGLIPNPLVENYVFNGANARQGLMLLDRKVDEPRFDADSWKVDGSGSDALLLDSSASPHDGALSMEFNFYSSWYGANGRTEIVNEAAPTNEKILMIGDSFGQALRWTFASTCQEVHWELSAGIIDGRKLEDRIEETGATKVVFINTIWNCASFMELHPGYLSWDES